MKYSILAFAATSIFALSTPSMAGGTPLFGGTDDLLSGNNEGSFYGGASMGKASNSTCAELQDQAGALTNGIIGDVTCEDSTAWKIYGGYKVAPNLAVEGSYIDFGEQNLNATIPANKVLGTTADSTLNNKGKSTGYGVSAVASAPVGDDISLFGKAGIMAWETKNTLTHGDDKTQAATETKTNGVDLNLGAGAEYKMNDNWGLRGEVEHVNGLGANLYSVGATFSSF